MKNVIHRESLAFQGATLEGWLAFLGRRFLDTYPQMERLVVSGRELRFDPAVVPDGEGGFGLSRVLLSASHGDHGVATGSPRDGQQTATLTTPANTAPTFRVAASLPRYPEIVPGDRVRVELSPYDLTKGRITFRER